MSYNIGPKIGIDGEKEFRKSMRDINDTYKALDAETKALTKAFEAQGDEQGKLEATSKQLQKQIDLQKQKMGLLEGAISKATDKFGENSIEATRLRGALYDTEAAVATLEAELKDTRSQLERSGDAMETFEDSTKDAGKAAVDFGDILKANLVSDLIMDGLREMAGLVKDFAVGSIDAAADVQAATAQFEQTFGSVEQVARNALKSISEDTDIATTRMQGRFTTIYAFAKNAGADTANALTISSRAMVVAADNAAYYDKSIEEATEQLQSFLKGNYENDAALGISATETTRNAKANELYAKSFQKLSESQKVDVLLAMVEAGNEASGAIGQAARESDSWENVTGELAEVMRLLQAEAGKPALKKLVPVIQKLTKKGYELIEDIDWEKFGNTVADIADEVIEYGPGMVRAIASVAAGIVAMKATQKAVEIASLAKSFISVGTAAQTAGNMVAASGTIASMSPWGLAAAAIATMVGLIVTAATDTETAADSLDKAMDKLEDSVAAANSRYEETKVEVDGAAYAAETYVKRLQELEEAGLDTAVAHKEYEMIVAELNELIPDLNLTIDEQTGLLNKNTDAILADIDAWKEDATAKALQEKFTDVLEAQGKAQSEVIEKQAELNILETEAGDLSQKQADVANKLTKALEEQSEAEKAITKALNESDDAYRDALNRYFEAESQVASLTTEHNDLSLALNANQASQDELSASISKAEETVASYNEQVRLAEESMRVFNEQTTAGSESQVLLAEDVQSVKDSLYNLALEFTEAKTAALESINTQIGLFDELTMKSDWSAEKILKNWESQRLAFDNYSANLQKAVDMGLDETLVQQLSDGSTESMQILNALVNDIDIGIDDINTAFSGVSESKETLAGTMADVQTDFSNKLDDIVEDAEKAGLEIPNGLSGGVKDNAYKFIDSVIEMATAGINWFEKIFDINSPSRVMETEAEYIVGGAAGSVRKNADEFEQSMMYLADSGFDAFLQERIDRAASYPDMLAGTSAVTTNSVAHNYGGMTFQIYQQPGESAEDLAYRVMDIMNNEVAAKEAAI